MVERPPRNSRTQTLGLFENVHMWRILGAAAIGTLVVLVARLRRRAAARKGIEVGAVSEGWVAQHRGIADD